MATTLVIPNADFSAHKIETVVFGAIPCTGISLDQQTKSLTSLSPFTLTATPVPANTTDSVVWTSSDDTVATVFDGVVTPLKLGTVTITATCGTQSASCAVIIDNVVPDFVASGAFKIYKGSNAQIAWNENADHSGLDSKFGIIASNNNNESVKTIDCNGGDTWELASDYRFVPIKIPAGAKRIKIESKLYLGQTLITFKSRLALFNSEQSYSTYVGAKCLSGKGSSAYDQDSMVSYVIYDIPDNITGLDSFAVSLNLSDWSMGYNKDYTDKFDVTFLKDAS